ncbi:MAG TPA: lipocalin family protein [Saprospiraceae bacterium]|nr:lipocalin family protein [Saprospiraceae bacterium]
MTNKYITLFALTMSLLTWSCVEDTKKSSDKTGDSKEELLLGTWIKSIDAGNKMIDIGFEFLDDHKVNYINQPRTLGKEWKMKGKDSLVLFYQNRIYGDSIESAVYYIESLSGSELRLRPRNATRNYLDIYSRK